MARRGTDAKQASLLLQKLPQKVSMARTISGMSQQQAAQEIGIGKATLQRIESGSVRADLSTLVKLLAWLDGKPLSRPAAVRDAQGKRQLALAIEAEYDKGYDWVEAKRRAQKTISPGD